MLAFRKSTALIKLSDFFSFLLFPGFFLYHYVVAEGYLPPILGGYFGIVALVGFFLLGIFGWRSYLSCSSTGQIIFYCLIAWNILVAVFNWVLNRPNGFADEIFIWSGSGVLFNILMFMIGVFINVRHERVYIVILLMLTAIVLLNIGGTGIFYVRLEAADSVHDVVSTYQGFARSLAFVSILILAATFQRSILFYPVALIALVALFFNGARTEFALLFSTIFFLFIYYGRSDLKLPLKLLLLLGLLGVLFYFSYDVLPESRMFQLVDIFESSSGRARSELMQFAIDTVSNNYVNFIFGGYGSYVVMGGVGDYPHNIFSAWMNNGVVGFLLYIGLFSTLWLQFFRWYATYKMNPLFKFYACLLFFTTAACLVSKDYSYMFIGLTVGVYAQISGIAARRQIS